MSFTAFSLNSKNSSRKSRKPVKDMFFISQGSFCKNIVIFSKKLYESFCHFVQKNSQNSCSLYE
jgi:uncharacterized protein YcsI (UPF0317 family)